MGQSKKRSPSGLLSEAAKKSMRVPQRIPDFSGQERRLHQGGAEAVKRRRMSSQPMMRNEVSHA
jgi:hypothetical protein